MRSYLAAFVIATLVSGVLTPLVRRWALRVGAVATGGGRHVHERKIPRLGGVAICLGLMLPIAGLFFVESAVADLFQAHPRRVLGLCLGGAAMCALGLFDDTRGIRALYKLYFQLAIAAFAFFCGFRIEAVNLPIVGELSMGIFALPVTMLWVVGIINAVNLIDGLDGLAAGVVFFAGVTNFVVAYIAGQPIPALIMAAVLGSVLGFLFYNFNPARIFMGDSGSYFLGYVLAVTALVGSSGKASTAVSLLVPVVALGVPIFDTLFSMVRRFLERRPIFSPDRGHVHHRLLDLGITHRRAVLILYGVSVVFTVAAIGIYFGRSWQVGVALLVASVVVVGLARFVGYFSYWHLRKRQQARVRSRDTELLRRALPGAMAKLAMVKTEKQLLSQLVELARVTEMASLSIYLGHEKVLGWKDDEDDQRRIVATMTYPLGRDALARAEMRVGVVSDFEDAEMAPQTDILFQVLADVVASNLLRLDSGLAPRVSPARDSQSELTRRADAPPTTLAAKAR